MVRPVVVGVDGTGGSLKALMWAAHRASLHGIPLRLVHALPRLKADLQLYPPGRFEGAQQYGLEYIKEATSLVRDAYPEMDIVTEMPLGTPARVLLAESKNAHWVVIGAMGTDIGSVLLGSTVLQLTGHAACPV